MAWRPTAYLIEGELSNTELGKVTGWMRFVGLEGKVILQLEGNFHRDIRGAAIRFKGDGDTNDLKAAKYMEGVCLEQTGEVGDITAGLPPMDYVDHPYIEWYSEENGRVVLEPLPANVKVIGRPIPAIESEPISRREQEEKLLNFMASVAAVGCQQAPRAVPKRAEQPNSCFTHWVVVEGEVVGEAHSVNAGEDGMCFAFVKLFAMPEMAEFGLIPEAQLQQKSSR